MAKFTRHTDGRWHADGQPIDPSLEVLFQPGEQELDGREFLQRAYDDGAPMAILSEPPWELDPPDPNGAFPARSHIEGQANILKPDHVGDYWAATYFTDGVLPNHDILNYAVPLPASAAVKGLAGVWVRAANKRPDRSQAACAGGAAKALADRDFPKAITQQDPAFSRTPEWLAERLLNGMYPNHLRKTGTPGVYTSRFDFSTVPRGNNGYVQPEWVEVDLDLRGAAPTVSEIRARYEPGEPVITVQPGDPWWGRARRLAASCNLLYGEIDLHIGRGHFVSELIEVAAQSCLVRDTYDNVAYDNPLLRVLLPRVNETVGVNHLADTMVWGDDGVMGVTGGLSRDSIVALATQICGAVDWKGFAPRTEPAGERYVEAARIFWGVVQTYVADCMQRIDFWPDLPPAPTDDQRRWHAGVERFVKTIEQYSVPARPFQGEADPTRWLDSGELSFRSGGKAMSPITTRQDLHDFCVFAVWNACHGHGWLNVRQDQDGGEVRYASFGLRARIDAPVAASPGDESWHLAADPCDCDKAYQLMVGELLSKLRVAVIMREGAAPADPAKASTCDLFAGDPVRSLRARLTDVKAVYDTLPVRYVDPVFGVDDILGCTNA